jgi:2-methylcitrate dehydratase PrpD
LVNATAGHVLDFDDTSYTGIMHGTTVAFPAALAAAEFEKKDGRSLLTAFIAGVEVTYAIALLCTHKHYFKGWWSTATVGTFGAAAAAAKAMELSHRDTVNALALAGSQSCGPKAVFGSDAKPYIAGRAAAIGVEAARLSALGLTGPRAIFEADCGFLNLLNDGEAEDDAINELGDVWRLCDPGIFFKQHPVCSAAHAATELTRALLVDNRIDGRRVRKVVCEVPPTVAISLVYDRPTSIQEAQFSMPFAVGNILLHGELDISSLTREALVAPELLDAMSKVEMRKVDSLHSDDAPECARVTVLLDDNTEISGYLAQPTGMPGNRIDEESLHRKFHRCAAAAGATHDDSAKLLVQLLDLEESNPTSIRFDAGLPTN